MASNTLSLLAQLRALLRGETEGRQDAEGQPPGAKAFMDGVRGIVRARRHTDMVARALQAQVDLVKSRMELGVELAEQLRNDRRSPEYLAAYEDPDPLVSVCIGTYNRGRLLTERAIPSVLAQTHRNVEVIVVGDCCTDDTAERISHIRDDRLRFVNLSERGRYPEEPYLRWMVAGTVPFNHALSLTRGQFVTHLDDDDEYLPDRVARLLTCIRETRADLVFHPFYAETPQGNWTINPAAEFFRAQVTTSSTFYHRWFARIRWDLHAYLLHEEGDWNRHRKMVYLGARIERYSEPLLRHYKERANQ